MCQMKENKICFYISDGLFCTFFPLICHISAQRYLKYKFVDIVQKSSFIYNEY